ncbi:MAG: hypothetical protein KIS72_11065 [Luteimonas sp.]|nr:hypothetical protein [Luteimonas sp.]
MAKSGRGGAPGVARLNDMTARTIDMASDKQAGTPGSAGKPEQAKLEREKAPAEKAPPTNSTHSEDRQTGTVKP